ncbi:MAG TPA: hypothetical protein VK633_10405 [Verrucomicrobiae bacterium]|nr:hypothetical protein [Verrucomicrobiae bacterium]
MTQSIERTLHEQTGSPARTRIWELEPETKLDMSPTVKVTDQIVIFEDNYGVVEYARPAVQTSPTFILVGLAIVSGLAYLLWTGQWKF